MTNFDEGELTRMEEPKSLSQNHKRELNNLSLYLIEAFEILKW